jgi:hypothetical protein
MATAATPKITTLGTSVDLTDTSVNPEAAPTTTPRQGGFTLRNRINFSNVSTSNSRAMTVNNASMTTLPAVPFFVLEVPERVLVRDLTLFAVEGQTVPGFNITQIASTSLTNSDLDSLTWSFGAHRNRKDVTNASYVVASDLTHITTANAVEITADGNIAGDVFGQFRLKVSTNEIVWIDLFDAIDGSLATQLQPMKTAHSVRNAGATATGAAPFSQQNDGEYFPYGGFVNMRFGPFAASLSASDVTATESYYASSVGATIDLTGVWEIQANCMYVPE